MIEGPAKKFLLPVSCDGRSSRPLLFATRPARLAISESRMQLPLRQPLAAASEFRGSSWIAADRRHSCETHGCGTHRPDAAVLKEYLALERFTIRLTKVPRHGRARPAIHVLLAAR